MATAVLWISREAIARVRPLIKPNDELDYDASLNAWELVVHRRDLNGYIEEVKALGVPVHPVPFPEWV